MTRLSQEEVIFRDNIKQRITDLLKEKGLSQSKYAILSDDDRQAINRWTNLNNNRGVSIYTIRKFCLFLDISLSEFFNDEIFFLRE
jgi:transcriptional regulator with XRE-family HTH domain